MAAKWKIPDLLGFAALIDFLKSTRKAADATASDVSGLQDDVQGLADRTTAGFQQANAALQTLDAEKLAKTNSVPFSIDPESWELDEEAGKYPAFYELVVTGVTAKDRASIALAPASISEAVACGMCPTCETITGKIIIRAAMPPSETITAEYWIETGKE